MVYESVIEEAIIQLLQNKGYELIDENDGWISDRQLDEFINKDLLLECLERINGVHDLNVLKEAIATVTRLENPSLFERNFAFHRYLIDGVTVESKDYAVNPLIRLIDFKNPDNNTFQVCHQVKFNEGRNTRIPDVIVYINGIPLIVMELKSFDEAATDATLEHAYTQLGSNSEHNGYRYDIPTLFNYKLTELRDWKEPSDIFVCSMADLFGEWIPDNWINRVFVACERYPQHRYFFLTKNPSRYIDLFNKNLVPKKHDNFWFGTTLTTIKDQYFFRDDANCFLSIEPIHSDFPIDLIPLKDYGIKWVIVGAETGNRVGKIKPEKEWVENIKTVCRINDIPIFMKDSLQGLMGKDFIQEKP